MTNRQRMELAGRAAREAGRMLLQYEEIHVDKKAKNDYVTDADRASENLIRKILLDACPEDGFYGEEGGISGADKPGMWVVDPIDGTTNFIHSLHPYTISIAYMRNGEPVAAAIYAPVTDEMFSAYSGGGAYLNDKPIRASDISDPNLIVLGMSFAHRSAKHAKRMFELIPRLSQKINDMRRLGSAAYDLCCVACGRYDAFIELNLLLYDIAAGVLIAKEAGAVTGGWYEDKSCFETGHIFAAAPGIANWLKDEIEK
ncbi:MAG: inositol monophosphatase [Clostridia bacterium]|nr:inositol monophosphatase [Clostridia bacterium]